MYIYYSLCLPFMEEGKQHEGHDLHALRCSGGLTFAAGPSRAPSCPLQMHQVNNS